MKIINNVFMFNFIITHIYIRKSAVASMELTAQAFLYPLCTNTKYFI